MIRHAPRERELKLQWFGYWVLIDLVFLIVHIVENKNLVSNNINLYLFVT